MPGGSSHSARAFELPILDFRLQKGAFLGVERGLPEAHAAVTPSDWLLPGDPEYRASLTKLRLMAKVQKAAADSAALCNWPPRSLPPMATRSTTCSKSASPPNKTNVKALESLAISYAK